MITIEDLIVVTGLVARMRNLEGEALRTRSATLGDELFVQIDRIRWRLEEYGVNSPPFKGKPGPNGKAIA